MSAPITIWKVRDGIVAEWNGDATQAAVSEEAISLLLTMSSDGRLPWRVRIVSHDPDRRLVMVEKIPEC